MNIEIFLSLSNLVVYNKKKIQMFLLNKSFISLISTHEAVMRTCQSETK